MGAFDHLIPGFRAGAKAAPEVAEATRPNAFQHLIPRGAAPDADVPAFRNSADDANGLQHRALPMPSEGVNTALKSVLGETLGNAAGYLPPVAIANSWMDAFAREKANPDQRSGPTQMLEGFENVMRGAGQGTNPNAQPEQQVLGEAFQDAGGAMMFQTPDGRGELVNPDHHVVLKDPSTGKLMAYSRSNQSNEGGLTGASRVITQGMLTGPVTGAGRATALVNEAAGALPGERAAKATEDLAAFERTKTPVFPPAFQEGPMRGLAKSIAETPMVGAPLNRALDRSLAGAGEAAKDVAGKFGSVPNSHQAGQTVREGIERFKDARPADVVEDGIKQLPDERLSQIILAPTAETSFKTKQGALYERAWRLIPEEMQKGKSVKDEARFMSSPSVTRGVLDEIVERNTRMINSQGGKREAPPIAGGLLGEMIGAVRARDPKTGRPVWTANLQTLRNMRSELRRLSSGMADTEKNVLKTSDLDRIQSLTQDMVAQLQANAAKYLKAGKTQEAAGIERSIKEFQRADQYTRTSIERMDKIEKLFNADTGEALARNITNAALDGNRGNIEMLQTLAKTLRPDEMGDVRSMLFSELGRPVGSARNTAEEIKFSVNSFKTRWNNMSPEAKALLFDGEHKQAVDDLVSVVGRLSNVEAMGNGTRSGTNAVNMSMLFGSLASAAAGDVITPLKVFGGGFATAYLMSRPAYAKWATQYLKLKSQTAAAPKAIDAALAVQVNRLAQMAQHDPQLQQIVTNLRHSPAGEVGVGQGSEDHRSEEQRIPSPGKGEGNQSSNSGASPNHGGSVSSGGLMINPLEIAGRIKKAWDDTKQPIVERGAIAPFGKYEDGSYHLAVPGIIHDAMGDKITDEAAASRARGNLRPGEDPELGKELAGESFAKAGLAAAGGVGAGAAGAVPEGAIASHSFDGPLLDANRSFMKWAIEQQEKGTAVDADFARQNAPSSEMLHSGGLGIGQRMRGLFSGDKSSPQGLDAVTAEIAELAPRYRQLFGKEFVAPKARPGTPADEVLKGEQQTLDELRSAVSSREGALAKAPDMDTTPKIRDITGERDELMGQAKANPFVKAVPGKQGLPKKKEELDAIERFYKNGGSLPPGPWGRDPLDYQKAVREAFDDTRQQIAKLNEEKAAAKSEGQVAKLKTELKAANEKAVKLNAALAQLRNIILGGEK